MTIGIDSLFSGGFAGLIFWVISVLFLEENVQLKDRSVEDTKLSEVLFDTPCRHFGSIVALPSNVFALESALLFASGMSSFLAVVGPSGCGKSHLLEAVSSRVGHGFPFPCPVLSAAHLRTDDRIFSAHQPLILDEVQDALEVPRRRQALRAAIEKRVAEAKPTLLSFTAQKPSRQLKNFLPVRRNWVLASLENPTTMERMLILQLICEREGLVLNSELMRIIASKMRGNGRTLVGALKRLKHYGTSWTSYKATLRACGILDPFFADNSSWDLKERILRCSESYSLETQYQPQALASYLMLKVAHLSEIDAARFLGLEPRSVYFLAAEFQREALPLPDTEYVIQALIRSVVHALTTD